MRMPQCSFCSERSVIYIRDKGWHLCPEHFREYYLNKVRRALNLVKLKKGAFMVLGLSGGKDSFAMLSALAKLKGEYGLELMALMIDEGISGYVEPRLRVFKEASEAFEIPSEIVSFRDHFGYRLDEMVRISMSKGFTYKPCTICGVFKRYLLNRLAREYRADYLATGHNMDDEVQVFLMNLLKGNLANISRDWVVSGVRLHEKFVVRVKPLYYCEEKEDLVYALLEGFKPPEVECPYLLYSFRGGLRRMINALEYLRPGTKRRMLALKDALRPNLMPEEGVSIGTCKECGEPSSDEVCKTCQLLNWLRS